MSARLTFADLQASPAAPGRAVRFESGTDAGADDAAGGPGAASSPGAAGGPGAKAEQHQGQSQVLGPDGRRAIDALFDGLAAEFHNMVRQLVPYAKVALLIRGQNQVQVLGPIQPTGSCKETFCQRCARTRQGAASVRHPQRIIAGIMSKLLWAATALQDGRRVFGALIDDVQ